MLTLACHLDSNFCKCPAVPNKASLKTGSSPSAAVQLCFSARRGLHVSRCLKMSKQTGTVGRTEKKTLQHHESGNIMIHVADFMWLEF